MEEVLPEGAERDFTATSYILEDGKVLLIDHEKLGMWIPPGGHVEEDEMPHETARRETLEETGIKVEFQERPETGYEEESYDLPRPFNINLHRIKENHWHCDFAFRARKTGETEASHSEEHNGTRWFTEEDLESESFKMPENIRKTCLRILREE